MKKNKLRKEYDENDYYIIDPIKLLLTSIGVLAVAASVIIFLIIKWF